MCGKFFWHAGRQACVPSGSHVISTLLAGKRGEPPFCSYVVGAYVVWENAVPAGNPDNACPNHAFCYYVTAIFI